MSAVVGTYTGILWSPEVALHLAFDWLLSIMPYTAAEVFARAWFYPSLLYTYVMSQVGGRPWYNRIDQTVLIGALPIRAVAKKLVAEEGVKGVVSVTEDFETKTLVPSEKEWEAMGVKQLKLSTTDYTGTPSQEHIQAAVDFILQFREQNDSVYVHCKAGRTRSATVVACYLVKVNVWTPEEAIDFIKSKRPHIWLREKQLKSIAEFYNTCKQTGAKGNNSTVFERARASVPGSSYASFAERKNR